MSESPVAATKTEQPKAVVKAADMSEKLQQSAVDIASDALEKWNIEKDIAAFIKREFDQRHGGTWHETGHFIYFYMGQIAILLFKSGN
ncbi:dynein light chain [Puccinia sorghi]|uniref:Dynein light chain n=1 Tax=Puccinia sorghi TaxID=27349 RepID=A0A0L6V6C6_9BASI|nr:dynein light chain [Puccinia sorghi]